MSAQKESGTCRLNSTFKDTLKVYDFFPVFSLGLGLDYFMLNTPSFGDIVKMCLFLDFN